MTNTKFRKRALLSSVAMLLVALVALGSATFAWFSASPTATASGVTAGTAKSSSLVIKEYANGTWASTFQFAASTMTATGLAPVTYDGTAWKTGTTDQLNRGYLVGDLDTVSDAYSAHSTVYIMWGNPAADGETPKTASITATVNLPSGFESKLANYMRIAFVPKATDDYITYAQSTKMFWGNEADDRAVAPATYTSASAAYNSKVNTGVTEGGTTSYPTTFTLGNFTQGGIYAYDVYIYFEGTDDDCIDNNSGYSISGISFTFNAAENA